MNDNGVAISGEAQALYPAAPWVQVRTTQDDWDSAEPKLLESMLTSMALIRAFESKVLELASQGHVNGPVHSAIGQEGAAVGSILSLQPTDQINGSHRAHHQFLAKALHYLAPEGLSATAPFDARVCEVVAKTLHEILGLADGYCKGRGGSMHLRWHESGNLGTNAIVGGGVPFAAGTAWSHLRAGHRAAVFTYFGDGAVNIGSVLETMNIAATWRLPLCFFIENNGYAVATTVAESTAEPRLSSRGGAFAIPAWKVDGMDAVAVHIATRAALDVMRNGGGPTLIEADVYRYFHQNGSLPGSAFGYRTKEEEAHWKSRDPIDQATAHVLRRGILSPEQVASLKDRAKALLEGTTCELFEERTGRRHIRESLYPSTDSIGFGVRGDLAELQAQRTEEEETYKGALKEAKFVDVIARSMHARMSADPRIVILGEDIHRLRGGTNGATRGLKEAFHDRILGTPISENAFVGLAGGIAMDGRFIPVVEFMYPDFLWVAADQLFNQIAKARYMFGGETPMPLVLRTKVAIGTGYGAQHSMDPTGIFATSVGWRIIAPATPFDYVGMMNSALACQDPVLVIEHVELYGAKGAAPVDDFDYFIPLGKAKVVRAGTALTILTYSAMVRKTVDAVNRADVDAEVIDLRTLDRAGIDWNTIGTSIHKTRNVLVVEQGNLGTSYGGLLTAEVSTRYFDCLQQPVQRLHGSDAWPGVSRPLEAAAAVRSSDIEAALRNISLVQGSARTTRAMS
jgi:2-oxoisovalerate dehydrogenase E1 component